MIPKEKAAVAIAGPSAAGLSIKLSVMVSDGSFEASLSFPVDATKDQRDSVVKAWLDAFEVAVRNARAE